MYMMSRISFVAMNLVPPLKPYGDTVNIQHTKLIWMTVTLCLGFEFLLFFQMSELLKTNQEVNFTNVTVSRL